MNQQWRTLVVQRLLSAASADGSWAYTARSSGGAGSGGSAEPTALACLALASEAGASDHVSRALQWLAELQRPDGGVPLSSDQSAPRWATSLALLAWLKCGDTLAALHAERIQSATAWLLQSAGQPLDRTPIFGHDTTLIGWTWTDDTHSWVEPTAYAILALRAAGMTAHQRVREGISLLWDRLLPTGGWNYGNTRVFEQMLRPFPATTGVALTALAGESPQDPVQDTLSYLSTELKRVRAPLSLGWGLIGLHAWSAPPEQAESWLQESAELLGRRDVQPHHDALLLLAGAKSCPLVLQSPEHVHGSE